MSNHFSPVKKSLLQYSEHLERATIGDDTSDVMPARKRKSGRRKTRRVSRKGFKATKGRVYIHVPGYQGLQTFSAGELIHKISKGKIRAAAKTILRRSGKKKTRKGKRKGRRKRKSRK